MDTTPLAKEDTQMVHQNEPGVGPVFVHEIDFKKSDDNNITMDIMINCSFLSFYKFLIHCIYMVTLHLVPS